MKNVPTSYVAPEIVVEAVLAQLARQNSSENQSLYLEGTPRLIQKRWSTLYFLTVIDSGERRQLVAKIKRFPDQTTAADSWQSKSLLNRGRREFETMTQVFNYFADQPSPLLSALRPQMYLPEINALVMDFVSGAPLYDEYIASPRLLTGQGRRRAEQMMGYAGQWLRRFHALPPNNISVERFFGPSDTFQALLDDVDNLCALGIRSMAGPLWDRTLSILRQVTDDKRVAAHGDFHLRNVIVLPEGGVLCLDTVRNRVDSPYFDLGKFVADLQTRRMMILSLGLMPSPRVVQSLTQAFLTGYLAGDRLAPLPLALYEGFFIFRKWVASLELIRDKLGSHAVLGAGIRNLTVNRAFYRIIKRWICSVNAAASSQSDHLLDSTQSSSGGLIR